MTWELSLVLKATVLLVAGLTTMGLASHLRASRRHLILASAFVALIALPLAAALMPAIAIPIATGSAQSPAAARLASITASNTRQTPVAVGAGTQPPSRPPALSGKTIARGLWLLGAAGILASLGRSVWSLRRLLRSGLQWKGGRTMASAIATEAGVDRTVAVMLYEQIEVPMTVGVVHPVILLPQDAPCWAEADLRRAFVHEVEHIRRGDWWTHLAARAVCGLYWFHPLVWAAWRQLGVEAERACDDAVVNRMNRTDYADQLVTLAARLSTPPPPPLLSMANRSDLSIRVGAILNPGQRRGRAGVLASPAIIGVVAILAGAIASLQAVAVPPAPARRELPETPRAAAAATAPDASQFPLRPTPLPASAPAAGRPARQQPAPSVPSAPEAARPTDQAPPSTNAASAPTDYLIGPADVLTIAFFRDKDVSGDVVVRPNGKISLPLINDIHAAGLTPDQLRQALLEARMRFEHDPVISVQVKQINSRKVYIVGQVNKPGVYSLTEPMTVLQLIAIAGGMNSSATLTVVVLRQVDGKNVTLPLDYSAFWSGNREQNIQLKPGDTVFVK